MGERAAAGMKEKPKKRRSGLSNGESFARQETTLAIEDDESGNEPTIVDDED